MKKENYKKISIKNKELRSRKKVQKETKYKTKRKTSIRYKL